MKREGLAKPRSGSGMAGSVVRVRPNLHTFTWFSLCCMMGYAGASQSNGAAYLLAFLTGALGVVSYVYARANLRGLEVKAGPGPLGAGAEILGVELKALGGHVPAGIEIVLEGGSKSSFVEQVPHGRNVRVNLRVPSNADESLRLMLRSAFPLGLVNVQRVLTVELDRPEIPPPAGDLPLPNPEVAPGASVGQGVSLRPPGREGDDFAGVREWQPGDSPRHVDWRAVARGRPLMVKTWSEEAGQRVLLDWNSLPLPPEKRGGQMVRWIQTCEQRGLPYALRVPEREITTGIGEAHARRCLQAVAEAHAAGRQAQETKVRPRIPPSHEVSAAVPRGPLAVLSAVLLLTVLPLWESVVPAPALLFFLLCLGWRLSQKSPAKKSWLPLTVTALGMAAVMLILEDHLTMEAGMAVLIVLSGGKALESRTPHDFQVLAMIGWFLCLCGLLADQGIGSAVYMIGTFALITGCMVRFRRAAPGFKAPAGLTAKLFLQALPLAAVLFPVFPRVDIGMWRFSGGRAAVTGVSTSLDPGKVLDLAKSTARAFRAEFPAGVVPPNNERYWRCVVLWECRGLSWNQGLNTGFFQGRPQMQEGDVAQVITLEPHGQSWIPVLDVPQGGTDGRNSYALSGDQVLMSYEPVRKLRRLEVLSRPQGSWPALAAHQRQAALQLPGNLSPAMWQVAREWEAGATGPADIVERGLNYLRSKGFEYTLEPGTYLGPEALDEFFLRRRRGFCEHFAAGFATMMRAAGVPARIVLGYQGGEMSPAGTHMIVRQSDAHAWTEVWMDEYGWIRLDPTAALAPGRVDQGLQSYMLGEEAALGGQGDQWWRQMQEQMTSAWDYLNDRWYTNVVSFNEENQFGWISQLGLQESQRFLYGSKRALTQAGLGLVFAVAVGLGMLFLHLWLKRPARDVDPWRRAWGKLARRLEAQGLPVQKMNEGPLAYAQRVGSARPELQSLADLYARARYGDQRVSLAEFRHQLNQLSRSRLRA